MTHALKAAWTVRCGLWPGEADTMRERAKQWVYTSADYEADCALPDTPDAGATSIFQRYRREATEYWTSLNDPRQLNWAELVFTWF